MIHNPDELIREALEVARRLAALPAPAVLRLRFPDGGRLLFGLQGEFDTRDLTVRDLRYEPDRRASNPAGSVRVRVAVGAGLGERDPEQFGPEVLDRLGAINVLGDHLIHYLHNGRSNAH